MSFDLCSRVNFEGYYNFVKKCELFYCPPDIRTYIHAYILVQTVTCKSIVRQHPQHTHTANNTGAVFSLDPSCLRMLDGVTQFWNSVFVVSAHLALAWLCYTIG
jgi:hypothetical protein